MDDDNSQVNSLLVHNSSSQQHDSKWKNTSGGSQKHNTSLLMQRLVNRTSSIEAIEKTILQSAPPSRNSEYDDESDLKNDFELELDNSGDDEDAIVATTKQKDKDNDKDTNNDKMARTPSASFAIADESDDESEDENDIVSKLEPINGGGNNANILSEMLQANTKDKKERKWKKYVIYSFNLWSRLSSLIDFFTDLVLLYKVMNVSKPNPKIIPLAISLFVSIFSPYILSYSSGVKLGM